MAALFVAVIAGASLVFAWWIAEARGSERYSVVAVFAVAILVLAVLAVRRAIRKASNAGPGRTTPGPE
jgi:hypothetical protein